MNHMTEYFKRHVVAPLINGVGKKVRALTARIGSLEGDTIRTWSASRTYATGDRVTLAGKMFKALQASTNVNPSTDTDFSHWVPEPNIGDWTPSIAGGTTPGTITYTHTSGRFYRTDTVVFLVFTIDIATYGADGVGDLIIGDLPFPADNVPVILGTGNVQVESLATDQGNVTLEVIPNTSTMVLKTGSGGVGAATVIPITELTANTVIRGQIMYEAPAQ